MRSLVVDVGNTTVHAAIFEGSPSGLPPVWAAALRQPVDSVARELGEQAFDRWVLGSVHPRADALAQVLTAAGRPEPVRLRGAADFPYAVRVRHPETVGVDRLSACLGAVSLGQQNVIVVDVGTAVTVDAARAAEGDEAAGFEGGSIVPGRRVSLRGLHASAAQLPELELWEGGRRSLPGKDTEEAIRHGLDVGLPAMIDALVDELHASMGDSERWLTGGDADWYVARSRHRFRHDPHLVLRGLWIAAEGPSASRSSLA